MLFPSKNTGFWLLWAWAVAHVWGCSSTVVSPELEAVSPDWGYNGDQTPIVLIGEHLYPAVEATDSETIDLDSDYTAWILTDPPTELTAVDLIDYHRLTAVVPPGLSPGTYDLKIDAPTGVSAKLEAAFQVTDTQADHIRATTDQVTWTVEDNAVVSLQVRDLAEAIVPLPLEVRVRASGAGVGEEFSFLPNTLEDQRPDPISGGIQGRLRADGQGYVAFTTKVPGEVKLEIEPTEPESVINPAQILVSFQAGEVAGIAIELPNADFSTAAGSNFEVGLRLVDAIGNTVTGVPASVLLTETCPGGTMSTFIGLLDEARAVVAATSATGSSCTENQVSAVGVAEGGPIAGLSESFDVEAGLLHHLEVSAAPGSVTAGTGMLNVSVMGVDTWANRVVSAAGGISLSDDAGTLALEAGNGTQTCTDLIDGLGVCTATLFQGGIGRTLVAYADAGASGESNPFTVLPGPGDHIDVTVAASTVEAGQRFTASIQLQDGFENPIELSPSELSSVAFFDAFGPIECSPEGEEAATSTYSFNCTCTRAATDNAVTAVLDSSASSGTSATFDVTPGPLDRVQVDLSTETVGESIGAGESLTIGIIAFDAYGNPVEDEARISLTDTAGGLAPDTVTLVAGHATVSGVFSQAIIGNTVTASMDGAFLGVSTPFNVEPGPPIGLVVQNALPWAWTGGPSAIRVYPVDAYGNLVPDVSEDITLRSTSGLGPDVSASISGDTTVGFEFEAAGLNDTIEAIGTAISGVSNAIDVVTDCIDGPPVALTVVGASRRSLCLGADDTATATLVVAPSDLLATHFLVGTDDYRTSSSSIEHTFEGAGRKEVRGLGIRSDGCADEAIETIHIGPVGPPVGQVDVSVTDGSLIAGTSGGDERTRVNISARTCTGDFADGGELLVRGSLGHLEAVSGTALSTTGRGVQVELDSDGAGALRWTMASVAVGGTPDLYVGTLDGSAFGQSGASVSGDDLPPRVIETTPMGTGGGVFSEVEIVFSEEMLVTLGMATLLDSVELEDPDGVIADWSHATWSADGSILTLFLPSPRDSSTGTWSLWVYDELRDSSGNRLDGDMDGVAGGPLNLEFGDVSGALVSVVSCQPSNALFRPDGDDGGGFEADFVSLTIATDGPAAWWQTEVVDANGALVHHTRAAPAGTETGTVTWDGRDQEGEVLENGLYTLEVVPTDRAWSMGGGCKVAVRIDNHLSPLELP